MTRCRIPMIQSHSSREVCHNNHLRCITPRIYLQVLITKQYANRFEEACKREIPRLFLEVWEQGEPVAVVIIDSSNHVQPEITAREYRYWCSLCV